MVAMSSMLCELSRRDGQGSSAWSTPISSGGTAVVVEASSTELAAVASMVSTTISSARTTVVSSSSSSSSSSASGDTFTCRICPARQCSPSDMSQVKVT